MAFNTFGTGFTALAKGMSWRYDMGAEMKRMEMLASQTQEYFKEKERMAKEWAELTKRTKIKNEADAIEYDADYMRRADEINKFKAKYPNWRFSPDLYGQVVDMTEGMRDNDITRRAEKLDKEILAFEKHKAENEGFIDTPAGQEMQERLNIRLTKGINEYMSKYGETADWSFYNPADLPKIIKDWLVNKTEDVIEPVTYDTPQGKATYMVKKTKPVYDDQELMDLYKMNSHAISRDVLSKFNMQDPASAAQGLEMFKQYVNSLAGPEKLDLGDAISTPTTRAHLAIQRAAIQSRDQGYDPWVKQFSIAPRITDKHVSSLYPSIDTKDSDGNIIKQFNGESLRLSNSNWAGHYNLLKTRGYTFEIPSDATVEQVMSETGQPTGIVKVSSNMTAYRKLTPKEVAVLGVSIGSRGSVVNGMKVTDTEKMFLDGEDKISTGTGELIPITEEKYVTAPNGEKSVKVSKVTGYYYRTVIPTEYNDYEGVAHNGYNNAFASGGMNANISEKVYDQYGNEITITRTSGQGTIPGMPTAADWQNMQSAPAPVK